MSRDSYAEPPQVYTEEPSPFVLAEAYADHPIVGVKGQV
jgi:hypothetical protein